MKKLTKFLSAAMALVMLCAILAVPAIAAQTPVIGPDANVENTDGYDYAFGLTKYMIVNNDATIPTETFKFQIAAGTAVAGTAADTGATTTTTTTGPVLSGILPTTTEIEIAFPSKKEPTPGAAGDGITNSEDKKYDTGTANFDFSTVTYTTPGIYRYVISEVAGTNPSITYDTEKYILDVVVGYKDAAAETAGTLSILGYYYYEVDATGAPKEGKIRPDQVTFPNTMTSASLTVSKTVTGTLGDKEAYFKFTVTVGGTTGYKYSISGLDATNSDISGNTFTNPTVIETNSSTDFWLKDGQTLSINGIPSDITYTVTEADYASLGYSTTVEHKEGDTVTTSPSGKIVAGGNAENFTNTKNTSAPTGVILQILPFTLIVIIAGVGLFFLMNSKRKKADR